MTASVTEYYLLVRVETGKSLKPLKDKFREMGGFYNGIGYCFPQESEESLRVLLSPLNIHPMPTPLPEGESFDSFRKSHKSNFLVEKLHGIDKELRAELAIRGIEEDEIEGSTLPEDLKNHLNKLREEKYRIKFFLEWEERMEKIPSSPAESSPNFTKNIGEWLNHYNVARLEDIPEPPHLFVASDDEIKKNRSFPGNKARLMQKGEATVIGGGPKTGKSLVGLNMSVATATGTSLFNIFQPSATGNVLYLSFEDDITVILNRLGFFKLNEDKIKMLHNNLFIHKGTRPLATGNSKKTVELTSEGMMIRELCISKKPVLIIIDTVSRAFSYDENCNATANSMLVEADKLFGINPESQDNPTRLYIQHLRKSSSMQRESLTIDSLRGAGAFAAGCRTVLGFESKEDKRILHMLGSNCGEDFDKIHLTKDVKMIATLSDEENHLQPDNKAKEPWD